MEIRISEVEQAISGGKSSIFRTVHKNRIDLKSPSPAKRDVKGGLLGGAFFGSRRGGERRANPLLAKGESGVDRSARKLG
jgi:hypothetical protein